jgi:hypothetical protein
MLRGTFGSKDLTYALVFSAMASHPFDHIQPVGPTTSRADLDRSLGNPRRPLRRARHSSISDFKPMSKAYPKTGPFAIG